METIIVFSHLRWDFVYQRPQQLLSRLAERHRVVFFEEPMRTDGEPFVDVATPLPNLQVCRPHTPLDTPGFHDEQLPHVKSLLEKWIDAAQLDDYLVWFYTPMALPLMQSLAPRAIVYDCMDELSAFLNAPRQLLQRETALLKAADLVFTGGPSLYQAKKDRSENVYCFPSSVDAAHFSRAQTAADEAPEQAGLPHPRLGFFGVIDERLDVGLIDRLARAHPEWQIVLVGPVVKIDPTSLPHHANVHYFGQQDYARLPSFVAGWDVCLLPFAQNAATRYISPTKTLEYMAAERPIVSTPITDVAEPYGDVVYLGDTPDAFIAACERALAAPDDERELRRAKMRRVLESTSWDATVEAMEALVVGAAGRRTSAAAVQPEMISRMASALASRLRPRATTRDTAHERDVVIGAGPTGLSAAYHLGADAVLLEQHDRVGGWCRSVEEGGFTFDHAGHIMFSNDPYVHEMYRMLLGDNVHWQDREAWIYSKNVYTRYPFQGSLYGLPTEVIKECIVGAVKAHLGASAAPSAKRLDDCCADGVAEATAPLCDAHKADAARPRNFEEFIYQVWGEGIARHFAVPYNTKLWTVPLTEMETSWLGGRVPQPDLAEMVEGALKPSPKPMGPNARFGYPLRGGFQALMDGFLPHLDGQLKLNTRVAGVFPAERRVTLENGQAIAYRTLVSTMPLPALIGLIGDEAPADVQRAAQALRNVSVRCVNLGIARERITDKHWIYYPEDTIFHRIFVQGNASPHCNAAGGFGFTCEISYSPSKPLPCDGDALIERCIADCVRVGMLDPSDRVLVANQVDLPYAYVVYDHQRQRNVDLIRAWLDRHDIVLAGRYSEWEYYNSDHAFLAGKKAASEVCQRVARRASAERVTKAPPAPGRLLPLTAG
jgi:protoporphyrinogen oxidase/glycosyltransferase involved in cell wall biosynthesis